MEIKHYNVCWFHKYIKVKLYYMRALLIKAILQKFEKGADPNERP